MATIVSSDLMFRHLIDSTGSHFSLNTHRAFLDNLYFYNTSEQNVISDMESYWFYKYSHNFDPETGEPIPAPPLVIPPIEEVSLPEEQLARFTEIKDSPKIEWDDVIKYVLTGEDGPSLAFMYYKMNKLLNNIVSRISALEANHA